MLCGNTDATYPAFPKESNRFRMVLGPNDTSAITRVSAFGGYPWRWGLNGDLLPGATRDIVGYVRFRNDGSGEPRVDAAGWYHSGVRALLRAGLRSDVDHCHAGARGPGRRRLRCGAQAANLHASTGLAPSPTTSWRARAIRSRFRVATTWAASFGTARLWTGVRAGHLV